MDDGDDGARTPTAPVVPGYRLAELIGSGASGTVWRASRDDNGDGAAAALSSPRDVAVKVVRAGAQAERELAVLSGLRHAHVVALHEAVPLADGSLALVLDLVEGGTLARLVASRGHLRPGEVVTVLAPLATTLAELHAHGIQHGDLAPGNVMLDRDGRPLLTDLGTVRITGEPRQEHFGTPGYVDPVVLAGGVPGPHSEVYGLGALAWFALTGSAPPSALLRTPLGDVVPGLPAALVSVVEEALDPDPERRPDPQQLARRLFDAAPAEPVWLTGRTPAEGGLTHRIRQLAAQDVEPGPRHRRRGSWRHPWRGRAADRRQGAVDRSRTPTRGRARTLGVSTVLLLIGTGVVVEVVAAGTPLLRHRGEDRAESSARSHVVSAPAVPARAVAAHDVADRTWPGPRSGTDAAPGAALSGSQVTEVVQRLTAARGRAFAAADPAAVDAVTSSGSSAERLARADVDQLRRAGLRYRGLELTVRSVDVRQATPGRLVVDVVTDVSAYDVVDGHDVVTRRVPAQPRTASRLVLVSTPQGWRVDDVLA
ncbi:MAG TPA: serine/threonine-protein kinase [Actinomycetales bacterium]|nr:serine/threonine-protein kinase [Actinomycetales bacterium]